MSVTRNPDIGMRISILIVVSVKAANYAAAG